MKIDKHISSLLYDHDCVIVTDFGGFVASRKTAQLNNAQHAFFPPSKKIAFNASLRNNDGLLAHHVSKNENILYAEACDIISEYVKECFAVLENGSRLSIEKIGVLFYDDEKNIQFVPDANQNFLKDSFGLSFIQFSKIKREEPVLTTEAVEFFKIKKKTSSKWKMVELVPVAALVVLMFTFPVLTKQFPSELGNLNPFADKNKIDNVAGNKIETVKQRPTADYIIAQALKKNYPVMITKIVEETTVATESLKSEIVAPVVDVKAVAEKIPAAPVSFHGDTNYNIIAGCFRMEKNAENLQSDLKAKGYDAFIAGKNNNGLTMVSVSSFTDLLTAQNALLKIQQDVNADAWIYKKHF